MIRTQIQLTEKQAKTLRRIAAAEGVSMAQVIRRTLDTLVTSDRLPDREELKRRAVAAIGAGHAAEKDLSTRHDVYLAEVFAE
jgi:hypothetical protein